MTAVDAGGCAPRVLVEEACTKCGRQFCQTPGRAKKGNHRCSPCESADAMQRRQARRADGKVVRFAFDPARRAATAKARAQRPEVKRKRADNMRRYAADPILRARHEARWAVRRAVASGSLAKGSCETCGSAVTHGHHDDYTAPLSVRWLCPKHHREWHRHNTPIYDAACGVKP